MSRLYQELAAFRQTHTIRTHVVAGHVWDVIESGAGEHTIVLLPGGGGSSESQFPLIVALESQLRVLSIGCPATLTTVREAADGVKTLLDEYDVSECYLLGHSLGGIFAQAFAITFPECVEGLILANVANYSVQRAAMVRAILKSARYLPKSAVITLLSARIRRLLKGHPDRDFWLEYFTHDELQRVGNEGIANRGACIGDSISRWSASLVTEKYEGPTLLLESNDETAFTIAERQAFRESYPYATVHTFNAAGHLSSITRHDEFVSEVLIFVGAPALMAPSQRRALR
jgi:esterase